MKRVTIYQMDAETGQFITDSDFIGSIREIAEQAASLLWFGIASEIEGDTSTTVRVEGDGPTFEHDEGFISDLEWRLAVCFY